MAQQQLHHHHHHSHKTSKQENTVQTQTNYFSVNNIATSQRCHYDRGRNCAGRICTTLYLTTMTILTMMTCNNNNNNNNKKLTL
eukprot:14335660-Ditylum_brightwellii.AAC.1